jgi:hypothetical protein
LQGVVTFGDPFNGAPIKGYSGPIATFCNKGDGVCTGNFELAPSHISYGFDTSAGLGQKKLLEMAAQASRGGGGGGGGLAAAFGKGGKGKGGKGKGKGGFGKRLL